MIDGVKLVIVGAPVAVCTVNGELLVAVPDAVVTVIVPVVAPDGTEARSCVAVAELTVADVPLNEIEFCKGVVLNPAPDIATLVPTGPDEGMNWIIEVFPALPRPIERIFPTGS